MRPTSIDAAFEWDEKKRAANIRKHGVDFFTAQTIFESGLLIIERRAKRVDNEERWQAFGKTRRGETLAVVYTWRLGKRRIITARTAGRAERANLAASKSSATPPRK